MSASVIATLESQSRLHPDRFDVWYRLGQAYGQTERHVEAERAFRHAVRLRPELHDAHYNLALSLAHQDRLRDSIEHFLSARRIDPRNPEFQKTLFPILVTLLQEEGPRTPVAQIALGPLPAQPLISVITPTRNRPLMLGDALESVRRQSYRNWEMIVVNDGGEDITPVLKSLPRDAQSRVVGMEQATNRGPAAARNAALAVAKGEVVAFLDDDDRYAPGHLASLLSGLRAGSAAFAYTAAELVRETVLQGKRSEVAREPFLAGLRYSRALLLLRNFIPINTWGVRRECFEAIGVFDEAMHYLEDWDFLLRLSVQTAFHRMETATVEYRVTDRGGDSLSKRHAHKQAVESFYARHGSQGHELVQLARELYLDSLT